MGNQVAQQQHDNDQSRTPWNDNKQHRDTNQTFQPPHKYEAISKDFDPDQSMDNLSPEKRNQKLQAGVFLNGKKMKFRVDKNGYNCFTVFPNGLSIIWGDTPSYWHLHNEKTSENEQTTVAQLRNVCWLQVDGSLDTSLLSPEVTYQVSFVIKLERTSYGWHAPVNIKLTLPNKNNNQERQEVFKDKPKDEWLRIPVGVFKTSPDNIGKFEFSLYQHGGHWKKGLVISCVNIEPKL